MVIFHLAFEVNILGWVLSVESGQAAPALDVIDEDESVETVEAVGGQKSRIGFGSLMEGHA